MREYDRQLISALVEAREQCHEQYNSADLRALFR